VFTFIISAMSPKKNNTTNNYEKIENFDDFTTIELAKNYKNILKLLGEDNLREGLDKTPERVLNQCNFFCRVTKPTRLKF